MPTDKEKKEMIRRFNILKGQIEGITKMIADDKECVEIIHQLKAVKSGFNRLGEEFIKKYLNECARQTDGKKAIEKNFDKALSLLSNY